MSDTNFFNVIVSPDSLWSSSRGGRSYRLLRAAGLQGRHGGRQRRLARNGRRAFGRSGAHLRDTDAPDVIAQVFSERDGIAHRPPQSFLVIVEQRQQRRFLRGE